MSSDREREMAENRDAILDEIMWIAQQRGVQRMELTPDELDDILNEIEDEVIAARVAHRKEYG